MRWLAYTITSAQNDLSNSALDNKHRIFSSKERFISLAAACISFVKWIPIPVFWLNRKDWSLYSPALSIWSTLIFLPVCFVIIFFHFKISKISNLYLNPTSPRYIINKRDKIPMASKWCSFGRTLNTNMNTIKKIFRAVSCDAEFHLHRLV